MSSLALTSGWYYICTSYYTPDNSGSRTIFFDVTVFSVISTSAVSIYTLNMLLNTISVQ